MDKKQLQASIWSDLRSSSYSGSFSSSYSSSYSSSGSSAAAPPPAANFSLRISLEAEENRRLSQLTVIGGRARRQGFGLGLEFGVYTASREYSSRKGTRHALRCIIDRGFVYSVRAVCVAHPSIYLSIPSTCDPYATHPIYIPI